MRNNRQVSDPVKCTLGIPSQIGFAAKAKSYSPTDFGPKVKTACQIGLAAKAKSYSQTDFGPKVKTASQTGLVAKAKCSSHTEHHGNFGRPRVGVTVSTF